MHSKLATCMKKGEQENPDKQDTYDTDQTNKTCIHAHVTHKQDIHVCIVGYCLATRFQHIFGSLLWAKGWMGVSE